MFASLHTARALAACRVPDPNEREIVEEWADRLGIGIDDGITPWDDAAALRLGVQLWCEGRIDRDGGRAKPPYVPRECP